MSTRKSVDKETFHRFIGLSLAGGKTDKACIAVIEYFPKHKKIFLTKIYEKIKSDEHISADQKIIEIIQNYKDNIEYLAVDVPYDLPLCLKCTLNCPGYELCKEPQIEWMKKEMNKKNKSKRPKHNITPYTQRAIEMYLLNNLEEPFQISHAMGANVAPLLARAMFLKKRLDYDWIEVFPKLSIWRIGKSFSVSKSHLRFHRHSSGGDESRDIILEHFQEHDLAFLYEQDYKQMIQNNHAFEAFVSAYTAFLKFKKQTEPRPESFPKNETWIEFPKLKINV